MQERGIETSTHIAETRQSSISVHGLKNRGRQRLLTSITNRIAETGIAVVGLSILPGILALIGAHEGVEPMQLLMAGYILESVAYIGITSGPKINARY